MISPDFEIRLRREAKTSLQVFKDQSILRRKFGDDGVRLYDRILGDKTAHELLEELGMNEEKFVSILEFMNNNGMVSVVEDAEFESAKSAAGKQGEEKEEWAQESEPALGKEPEEKEEGLSEKEEVEGKGGKEEGEGSSEEEEGKTEEDKEKPGPEKSLPDDQGRDEALRGMRGRKPRPPNRAEVPEEEGEPLLSPLEKVLFEKYGDVGVRIYNLIDGEKTAEEILRQTGVTKARLVEILEFMDEQGIIKLEKPPEKEPGEKPEEEERSAEPEQEPRFKPMIEEEPEEMPFTPPKALEKEKPKPRKDEIMEEEEELEREIVMVDVPELAKLSLIQKALLFAELSTKFGKSAKDLIEMVDGKRDFIDLSLGTGLSFFDVDAIMAYFGKKGLMSFRQLGREDIKKKYGEDGFAIYKRFGRDGLLLYEMIGKEASLKDIIVKSKLEVDRAIEILIFIHRVLGLDVPIDKGLIYRQLGMRKPY